MRNSRFPEEFSAVAAKLLGNTLEKQMHFFKIK